MEAATAKTLMRFKDLNYAEARNSGDRGTRREL